MSSDIATLRRVRDPFVPPLKEADLGDLSSAQREAAWQSSSASRTSEPFDLARGPVWRCCLYRLGERESVLQCVMHHAISDGWSLQILQRELVALKDADERFEPSPLPALPIQFADYAFWQRKEVAERGYADQPDFWRAHLADAPTN